MDSAAREARRTIREGDTDKSRCLMALLPPETKIQVMSYISTQQSLSRLSQSCRAWYETATEELYTRDAKEHRSFAMKWMAAHAVDEQTTDSAIGSLGNSRRWGGQIDAVHLLSQWDIQPSDEVMYELSTALHFAVFLGNMRLTKTILKMKASLTIPCPALLWTIMGAEELLLRVSSFQEVFDGCRFGPAFPIFLAFLKSDPDMCKLLIDHGAGREAINVETIAGPKVMSILHFAAVDRTTDYRQWQCLFEGFYEYIDEPCPRELEYTPLHVALRVGCTQGMQIAVESGAEKASRNGAKALMLGLMGLPYLSIANPKPFEEHARCLWKFDHKPPTQAFLKESLSNLVGRGLNLTTLAPASLSPLYRVLCYGNAKPEWLVDLLCEKGATIHEHEASSAFLSWCETSRLWETNKYDAWWQHLGQEDEIFLKWCEHPYNAWWWQHVKHISPFFVSRAYQEAIKNSRKLFDILTHLPLSVPLNGVFFKMASNTLPPCSRGLFVQQKFQEDFFATWSLTCEENIIHLMVRLFIVVGGYSATDATRDILHLRDMGADMTSRNSNGKTPLEILLESGSSKDDVMELVALLEGKVKKVQELA
ncbi:uncharacterized protein CPUR_05657 [Claviceps purpurea 20.1]|uniref:F-box domain-containing protein n=1 Tax=Claviceps purpurea (strain 20.1) TaxID=1111077 RepID=M1VWS9_CLAP2|nr:uncharacterized protein CPUR_05657 [Claviceps purpurea 20.1]